MRLISLMLFSTVALVAQAPAAADLAQKFNAELPGITQMLKELKATEALAKMQGLVPAQRPAFNASSAQAIGQSLDNAQGLMSLYRLWANVYSEAGLWEKAVEVQERRAKDARGTWRRPSRPSRPSGGRWPRSPATT